MKAFQILLIITILSHNCISQNTGFNYQAQIRDDVGRTLDQEEIILRLSILEGSAQGENIFSERHVTITDKAGIVNIQVGLGELITGNFSEISWGSNSFYLMVEISFENDNFKNVGTSQIMAVPLALYAMNSPDSNWKKTNSNISYMEGNVGIGTISPETLLEVRGDASFENERYFVVRNEGHLNNHTYITAKTASSRDNTASIFEGWKSRGTFDIPENVAADDRITTMIGMAYIDGDHRPLASFNIHAGNGVGSGSYSSYISFSTTDIGQTARKENVRIDGSGNLGVGTSSPNSKIHVSNGDIYLDQIGSGVIMTDDNGNCWRVNVNTDGTFKSTSITCP